MYSAYEFLQTWPSCLDFLQNSVGIFTLLPFTSPNTNAAISIHTLNYSHALAGLELKKSLLRELFKEEGGFSTDEKDKKWQDKIIKA